MYFYSANDFFKEKFNTKIIKLSLDGGFTCPNRDGTKSDRGCFFCSNKGSGDFAGNRDLSVTQQIATMKDIMKTKWKKGKYMAYFQAYTNTYAPIDVLREKYYEALNCDDIVAISVATRPDCVNEKVCKLLSEINKKYYVSVELGLQTSNEKNRNNLNCLYSNKDFENACSLLNKYGIDILCHIIIGLPHEDKETNLKTLNFALSCNVKGVKFQMLHIIKNTPLYEIYTEKPFKILTMEEYIDTLIYLIERTPEKIVIHRVTGDGNKKEVFEPTWTFDKRKVLNTINKSFKEKNTHQGKYIY